MTGAQWYSTGKAARGTRSDGGSTPPASIMISVRGVGLMKTTTNVVGWLARFRLMSPRVAVWCVNAALGRMQFRVGEGGEWRPLDLPRVELVQ